MEGDFLKATFFFSIFSGKKSSLEKMDLGETKEGDFFFKNRKNKIKENEWK